MQFCLGRFLWNEPEYNGTFRRFSNRKQIVRAAAKGLELGTTNDSGLSARPSVFCFNFDQILDDEHQSIDHFCHFWKVDLVRCIGCFVVMRVSKGSGVRNHQSNISLLPERPVIGPTHSCCRLGQRRAFAGDLCMLAKLFDYLPLQLPRTQIRYKTDKVTGRRVKQIERRGVFLTIFFVGEKPHRL